MLEHLLHDLKLPLLFFAAAYFIHQIYFYFT